MKSLRRFILPVLFGGIGFLLGGLSPLPGAIVEREFPTPHHVPKHPGNLTLRFAMVHDVIHDRFKRHGPDYYRARNRAVEMALQSLPTSEKESARRAELLDDLGVGLAMLGQYQSAADLLRKKLREQVFLGREGKELYSTYANLGTVLILWQLSEGVKNVSAAKVRIKESVDLIQKAVEIYPDSHFGREIWQLTLEQFLLAALDSPDLLLRCDMIGNNLDKPFDPALSDASFQHWQVKSQGPQLSPWRLRDKTLTVPNLDTELRHHITRVGAEPGWHVVRTVHRNPVPFDEPTLGIVGMWRMGAGANPHFALALGEIMLRVGQRHIAWTAYERAHGMREQYWSDQRIQEGLGEHCRRRQTIIELSLPAENWSSRREQFEKDLAAGQSYQKAYQAYEAQRLAAGTPVNDQHFYDDFEAVHGPIATPVGNEERLFLVEKTYEVLPWRLFFAGLLAFLASMAQSSLAGFNAGSERGRDVNVSSG